MTGFENLEVWKASCRLTVDVYRALKDCRDLSLKDQMCRAALSIPSNIAEGSARSTAVDFKHFLSISAGSLAELRTQLYIASRLDFLTKEKADSLIEETRHIAAMLQKLRDSLTS